jgi:peptidoglycan glycosyltransferase
LTHFAREINRLLFGILAAFGIIILASAYYGVVGQSTLLPREDNPRLVEAAQSVLRGNIYDRHDVELVRSTLGDDGFAIREYHYPTMASAIGYYSYRYGTSTTEFAYNSLLSGENLPATFSTLVLNAPAVGVDIRLTYDLEVQQAVVEAMGDTPGAIIVMTVPGGEILSLVSMPTFDPNTLDEDWDMLIDSPGNPFFNRVLQGRYQPGSLLQLPLLITSMVEGQPLSVRFPSGAFPIQLDDLTLTCLLSPPQSEMTMREAYLYGCPAPFAQIAPSLGPNAVESTFDLLRLTRPITLPDFTLAEVDDESDSFEITADNLQENVLGQGDMNASPLSVTMLTAAIINDGNAPQPRIMEAYRLPDSNEWTLIQDPTPSEAYLTAPNARRLSEILRESATIGTASGVEWNGLDVGGQAAIAYSGNDTLVWFTGFAILENKQNVVVTVVLENTDDLNLAATVAHEAIRAADAAMPTLNTNVTQAP